jgi:nucleotide-binding universal stress UspA family protein
MGPAAVVTDLPFRSVVLATDLSTVGLRAAQYAASICESFLGSLALLHVIENVPKDMAVRRSLENTVRQEVRTLVPDDPNLSAHPEVRFGDPADEILELAGSTEATLIVMAARHRGSIADHAPWGTLSRVIHKAQCGVMVVRGHLA